VQGPGRAGAAWIYHLQVEPAARRQGVAAQLMRHAATAVRERGAQHLELNVFGDNSGAIALYESLGFAVTAQQMSLPLAER
jgi:ribosomal protein S18 acetylase RimI-like enzyme